MGGAAGRVSGELLCRWGKVESGEKGVGQRATHDGAAAPGRVIVDAPGLCGILEAQGPSLAATALRIATTLPPSGCAGEVQPQALEHGRRKGRRTEIGRSPSLCGQWPG